MDELGSEGVLRAVPDLDLHEAIRVARVLSGSYKGAIGGETYPTRIRRLSRALIPATPLAPMAHPIP